MPLPHRISDNKRYHYNGHSNLRYDKKSTHSYPYNNGIHTQVTSTSLPSSKNLQVQDYSQHRQSRYNPNPQNNSSTSIHTSSSRSISRYNPEPISPSPLKTSGLNNSISRWSVNSNSRYNPQASISQSNGNYYGYHKSHYNKYNRIRSMESNDNYGMNYSLLPSNFYHMRTGKWKDCNSSISRPFNQVLDYDSYGSGGSSPNGDKYSHWKCGSQNFLNYKLYNHDKHESGFDNMIYDNSKFNKTSYSLGSSLINSVTHTTRKNGEGVKSQHYKTNSRNESYNSNNSGLTSYQVNSKEGVLKMKYDDKNDYSQKLQQEEEEEVNYEDQGQKLCEIQVNLGGVDSKMKRIKSEDIQEMEITNQRKEAVNTKSVRNPDIDIQQIEVRVKPELKEKRSKIEVEDNTEKIMELHIQEMKQEGIKIDHKLSNPLTGISHISNFNIFSKPTGYPFIREPINSCIFPMKELQYKLWELKNRTHDEIIANQKYLLEKPIKNLADYSFFEDNILIHRQKTKRFLTKILSKLKKYEYLKQLSLKKQFFELNKQWIINCEMMDEMTQKIKKQDLEEHKYKERDELKCEEENPDHLTTRNITNNGPRRRNRADFVDDAEIENVLLKIDPDYKHHQLAASIPPMILDPIKRDAIKFKDVNNLVTDKVLWAQRVLLDAVDTFTESEHMLFIEGYLTYPKKFGKISNYMGGLRTPNECVLHYYRTKKLVNYKKLIMEKNKKRKNSASRRRKELKDRHKNNIGFEDENSFEEPVDNGRTNMEQIEINISKKVLDSNEQTDLENSKDLLPIQESKHSEKDDNVKEKKYIEGIRIEKSEENNKKRKSRHIDMVDNISPSLEYNTSQVKLDQDDIHLSSNVRHDNKEMSGSAVNSNDTSYNMDESMPKSMDSIDTQSLDNYHKKKVKHNESNHKTSYWSVKESEMFPLLLKEFGSHWDLISGQLGTKSATMVRNYFQRKVQQNNWQPLVEEGNAKIGTPIDATTLSLGVKNVNKDNSSITLDQYYSTGLLNHHDTVKHTPDIRSSENTEMPLPSESSRDNTPKHQLIHTQELSSHPSSIYFPVTSIKNTSSERDVFSLQSSENKTCSSNNHISANDSIGNEPDSNTNSTLLSTRRPSIKSSPSNREVLFENVPPLIPKDYSPPESNVIVQELNYSAFTSPNNNRTTFLSSILNPQLQSQISEKNTTCESSCDSQILNLTNSQPSSSTFIRQLQDSRANINFSNDPLATLAAVASAPEALGLLQKTENNTADLNPNVSK